MDKDIFGNLMDWVNVMDSLKTLRKEEQLDDHQNGLVRILRFPNNWRLREAALEMAVEVKRPEKTLLGQVLSLVLDENIYIGQRVLAAKVLAILASRYHCDGNGNAFPAAEKEQAICEILSSMKTLSSIPQPPLLFNAIHQSMDCLHDCIRSLGMQSA